MTNTLSEETLFILFKNEVFILYKFIQDRSLHAIVQKVGVQSNDFKCSFYLKSEESPVYSVRKTFPVVSLEKMRPQEVLNKGMGLILTEHVARPYIGQKQFTVVVELDEVKYCADKTAIV